MLHNAYLQRQSILEIENKLFKINFSSVSHVKIHSGAMCIEELLLYNNILLDIA